MILDLLLLKKVNFRIFLLVFWFKIKRFIKFYKAILKISEKLTSCQKYNEPDYEISLNVDHNFQVSFKKLSFIPSELIPDIDKVRI